jgi:hypothetical protein
VRSAREQERRSRETNLRENSWWATQLSFSYQYDMDPRLLLDESLLAEVTTETVQRDARLWIRLDNYVKVSLFPEGIR